MAAEVVATAETAVTGPIVQVSRAAAAAAAAADKAVESAIDHLEAATLTDDADTSKDAGAATTTTCKSKSAKGPTYKVTGRNSHAKGAKANKHHSNGNRPAKPDNVAQDLVRAADGAIAKAGVVVKVLKTGTGHEVLNAGEYYYKISTIRWKCGFIENGCYYWLCMMNAKTLCQSTIKTTIIDGKHRVVKDNHRHSGMKHNHAPEPHAEVLIALLRGD